MAEETWLSNGNAIVTVDGSIGAIYGNFNIVADITVSADCDYVDFTGLDGDSAGAYILYMTIVNPTAANEAIDCYANGDYTAADYYSQLLSAYNTTVAASRYNDPRISTVDTSERAFIKVTAMRGASNYFRFISEANRYTGSAQQLSLFDGSSTGTITNITSLRIAAATGGIGVGSRLILTKVKK